MDTHRQSRGTTNPATGQAFEESSGRLDTQTVAIDDLTPFPGNPRRGSVVAIKESLEQNGQYRPIVVRRQTMEVLAGTTRCKRPRSSDGRRSRSHCSTATTSRRGVSSWSTTAPTTSPP